MLFKPDHDSVLYVAKNMRAMDKEEIYSLYWNETPFELVNRVMSYPAFCWMAAKERPIAIFGMFEVRPKAWTAFCFATDEFPRVALEITRFLKRTVKPHLFDELGAWRVEAVSHGDHHEAHRWLKLLGAKVEGVQKAYNKRGEDYVALVMTRQDWLGS